jgi:hypothetical protein
MQIPENSGPDNKLTLEWVQGTDGVALVFDKRTWKIFEDAAKAREQSAKHMILSAVVGTIGPIPHGQLRSEPLPPRKRRGLTQPSLRNRSAITRRELPMYADRTRVLRNNGLIETEPGSKRYRVGYAVSRIAAAICQADAISSRTVIGKLCHDC